MHNVNKKQTKILQNRTCWPLVKTVLTLFSTPDGVDLCQLAGHKSKEGQPVRLYSTFGTLFLLFFQQAYQTLQE